MALKILRVSKAAATRQEGASWLDYGRVAGIAFRRATAAVSLLSKFVGGTIPSRATRGGGSAGGGGRDLPPPVTYVDAATQERALDIVVAALHPRTGVMGAEVAREFGPYLFDRVCYGDDELPTEQCLGVASGAVVSIFRTARAGVLGALLHPARLARVTAGQVMVGGGGRTRPPSVAQLLRRVTGALWAEVGPPTALQRDAQAQWMGLLRGEVDRKEDGDLVHHPLAVAAVAGELRHIHDLTRGSKDGVLVGLAALTRVWGVERRGGGMLGSGLGSPVPYPCSHFFLCLLCKQVPLVSLLVPPLLSHTRWPHQNCSLVVRLGGPRPPLLALFLTCVVRAGSRWRVIGCLR